MFDSKSKRQPLNLEELLQNIQTPTSLFESLSSVEHKRLYLDIDCKRCGNKSKDISAFVDLVFKQLNFTYEYYIYGGYANSDFIARKYNLEHIPEADKAFSLHVVFPYIIVDSQQVQNCMYVVSHQCEFRLNFIFDQVVYGLHEKMRHPMYNKIHKQIACNKLIDSEGRVFSRSKPTVNTDIFCNSFITTTSQETKVVDNKKLRYILRLFYISEFDDDEEDVCVHVIDTPSGLDGDEFDRCLYTIDSLKSAIYRLDYDLVEDQSKVPILQDLAAVLQQYYDKLKNEKQVIL